jgi:hypothetical protein
MELWNSNSQFFKKSNDEVDKAIEGTIRQNTSNKWKQFCKENDHISL